MLQQFEKNKEYLNLNSARKTKTSTLFEFNFAKIFIMHRFPMKYKMHGISCSVR